MNDQRINPSSGTMQQQRLPYAKPELIELDLKVDTEAKASLSTREIYGFYGPS